ncbi:MAG: TatD family hydrolase [Candidatus Omnitrophota bacterium]|nr:TatD family hydrolase [Candidatus Omnitrophota bacterium]
MLIDSHCHINSLSASDRESVVSSSLLDNLICIDSGIDYKTIQESVSLSQNHPFIYTAAGFHPFSASSFSSETIDSYKKIIDQNKKIVAIGEIGLDSNADISLDIQEKALRAFISFGCEKKLPVMLHNRMSDLRMFKILDDFFPLYEKVVFHCFSYGVEVLDKILDKGGIVSFSLNVLRNKKDIIASLKKCPLQNLLFETDSPYMRIKGVRSTPLDIEKVYEFAAKTKGIPRQDLETAVFSNTQRIFQIL